MFNGRLCDFQTEHEENLLNKCADHEEMVLYAPTGSGKTVMVCKFIDDYLDENPDTVFLWLCPGAGGLHKQSQDSFDEFTTGIPYGDVYSFISEPDPKGQVFFINWDKINSASNVVLKEGEHKDFMSKIYECHNSNIDIFMLIDEEHKYRDNMTNAEIIATNQDYILQIDKLDKIRTTILTERFKETIRLDMEIIYIYGATGTGKTRGVYESNGYSNVYRVTDYLHPFDGYNCQPVICFDEFRSSIKLKEMLLYCDIYPLELPSRFSNKYACYNKVYIVSNWSLEKQYHEIQREDMESWKAFLRRIHKVIVYDKNGSVTEYKSVQEYQDRNEFMKVEDMDDIPFL